MSCFPNGGQNEPARASLSPYVYFCFSIAFYFAFALLTEGDWLLSGEMFSDAATNYFVHANSKDLLTRFFATDIGYIPLPIRALAAFGASLQLRAGSIPYFYNACALIVPPLLTGVFCLPVFRSLCTSDVARFLLVLAILIAPDFETRGFVNISYFGIAFCAFVLALAVGRPTIALPPWAWIAPILMMSKPSLFAVLPATVLALASIKNTKSRLLLIACFIMGILQFCRLGWSYVHSMRPYGHGETVDLLAQIQLAPFYFARFLGVYLAGPNIVAPFSKSLHVVGAVGLLVLLVALPLFWFKRRDPAYPLFWIGASILASACLLNVVISPMWNKSFLMLTVPTFRHQMPLFIGFAMAMFAAIQFAANAVSSVLPQRPLQNAILIGGYLIWFVGGGWLAYGAKVAQTPPLPFTGNSNWQAMAPALDAGIAPICVPVDPFGWLLGKGCYDLVRPFNTYGQAIGDGFRVHLAAADRLTFATPKVVAESHLLALAIPLRPILPSISTIQISAKVETKDGTSYEFIGARQVSASGATVLLNPVAPLPQGGVTGATRITVTANPSAALAIDPLTGPGGPFVQWLGYQ